VRASPDGYKGAPSHLAGELFKIMAGIDMVHVPYRGGGPAVTDLLGGQVQVMFATSVESIGYIRAGRLRALAVTSATRSDVDAHYERARAAGDILAMVVVSPAEQTSIKPHPAAHHHRT
jgi:tripartite-type tricarboxylate transporter receptor subunit TctC